LKIVSKAEIDATDPVFDLLNDVCIADYFVNDLDYVTVDGIDCDHAGENDLDVIESLIDSVNDGDYANAIDGPWNVDFENEHVNDREVNDPDCPNVPH
jgi:hypothetical protein